MPSKCKRLQSSSTSKASKKRYSSRIVQKNAAQSTLAAAFELIPGEVDNATMEQIKDELQFVMNSGKWMRLAARIPVTANFLLMSFGVGLNVPVQLTKVKDDKAPIVVSD